MPAKGNDNSFLLKRKDCRLRRWTGTPIRNRSPLPLLGDGLGVDAMTPRQRSQALLTMLYRSTNCLCRAGAPMKNLSHSASLCTSEKYALSNPGTIHLGPLVLLALGFSGAWIGNLTRLEPYRPYFIGAALVTLLFAARQIFRPAAACKPGEVCALPQIRRGYKTLFGVTIALVAVVLLFPYIAKLFY